MVELTEIESFEFEDRMSDSDALMWSIEKDPLLRSTIVTVSTFEGQLDHERVRHQVDYLSRVIPRLRQRVRANPLSVAPPRWEFDPYFDLGYHLRFATVSEDATLHDVLALAEPVGMQGFDRARPLWELTVVDGMAGGSSAIIIKIHHSITDGVGGMKLQFALFDLSADQAPPELPPEPNVHVLSQPERMSDALAHETRRNAGLFASWARRGLGSALGAVSDPVGALASAEELSASVVRMIKPATPMSKLITKRSLSVRFDTLAFPLAEAKAAGRAVGGRLNDAFVAGVALGLRRYHEAHAHNPAALRMNMPISIRTQTIGNQAGNAFIPARVEVPLTPDDPAELMRRIRVAVLGARDEPANDLMELLSNGLNRLPTSMTSSLFGAMLKGNDFTASNVPGAPIPVYLVGNRMTAQYAFGPNAGSAMNLTLVSYADTCFIGVNVDPVAVPDPQVLMACLAKGYDEVLALGR
ncbi:MAG: wax ester/triacylglycerol synthase family O-acyltransferase [Microthrixaceae bacterium]